MVFAFIRHKTHQMLTFMALKPNLLYVPYKGKLNSLFLQKSQPKITEISALPSNKLPVQKSL